MSNSSNNNLNERFKDIFLKYIIVNGLNPTKCTVDGLLNEYSTLLTIELNELIPGHQRPAKNGIIEINTWIESVKQIKNKNDQTLSRCDKTLRLFLHQHQNPDLKVRNSELQFVIGQLDSNTGWDGGDAWENICWSLKLKTKKVKSLRCCSQILSRELTRILYKKLLLNLLQKHKIPIRNQSINLNPIENRLFKFIDRTYDNENHHLLAQMFDNKIDEKICRLCFQEDNVNINVMSHIEEVDHLQKIPFIDKLNKCITVRKINLNDGYPQYICKICQYLLDKCYQFRMLCENMDRKLSGYLLIENRSFDSKLIDKVLLDNRSYNDVDEQINIETDDIGNWIDNDDKSTDSVGNINPEIEVAEHVPSHSIVKMYKCDICEGSYAKEYNLKIHMKRHSGEKAFICEICGKGFKSLGEVKNHIHVHGSVKHIQCPNCPYQSNKTGDMKKHALIHLGYLPIKCPVCCKSFRTSSSMQKHRKRLHLKERLQKCTICDKTFFAKKTLIQHLRIHTGDKPFQCDLCPNTYSTYIGFKLHMKRNHFGVTIPMESSFLKK